MSRIRLSLFGESRILVGDKRITPSASHSFALLLVLAAKRPVCLPRQDLQSLLFAHDAPSDHSHSLRQLLYRLKQLGVRLEETDAGIRLQNEVDSSFSELAALQPRERAARLPHTFAVLPNCEPTLPQSFTQWLDGFREGQRRKIVDLLTSDLNLFRNEGAWREVLALSDSLLSLGSRSASVTQAHCEALCLLGRREEALRVLEDFLEEPVDDAHAIALRQLRSRIARSYSRQPGIIFGRDDTFAHLASEWALAEEGQGRLTVLIGVGGIGKTSVADAFSDQVRLKKANILRHRCDANSADYPLSLFAHIVPKLRAMRGSAGVSPRSQGLLTLFTTNATRDSTSMPDGFSLEALRSDIQTATIDLVDAVSAESPILLIIDDAHFLDAASCDVLRELYANSASTGLLIVACIRPQSKNVALLGSFHHACVRVLRPLSQPDSLALLTSGNGDRPLRPDEVEWCLRHSDGNPFYLHSLAKHCRSSHGEYRSLPSDIHSLAARSYYSLPQAARLILEACLLLRGQATLSRLRDVVDVNEPTLLEGLRYLEDHDLIRMEEGAVVGPHMLLHEAVRTLVPTSVAAVLTRRIAEVLSHECIGDGFDAAVAMAAADRLIESDQFDAACQVLMRVALQAAALGEPRAAAELLIRLLAFPLAAATRRTALEAIIQYGDAAGLRDVVLECLRERQLVARQLAEPSTAVRALELRIIEADLLNGADFPTAISPLASIIDSPLSDVQQRVQATVALLIIADAEYDAELAHRLFTALAGHQDDATGRLELNDDASDELVRAHLVYHTTFGDNRQAQRLAKRLLNRYALPSMDQECRVARRFAAFALYRMLHTTEARRIIEADYRLVHEHSIWSEALYASSLLTEIAISDGDFVAARSWHSETSALLKGTEAHKLAPNSGYSSSAAMLAMMDGQYSAAEAIIALPQEHGRMRSARYEAIRGALRLRLYMLQGRLLDYPGLITRLRELYGRGRSFGGQDTIVEVLWCHEVLQGDPASASQLLGDYLDVYRKESAGPEWLIRHTTAADSVWLDPQRRAPADMTRRNVARGATRSAGGNNQPQKSLASS
jgi:DNA-binding SARP family transcriptional activator